MLIAQKGHTVHIHYVGSLPDGEIFDSSEGQEPLSFTLGAGDVIPGFDAGVLGMKVGDTKHVEIAPEDAYGEHREDLMIQVPLSAFPAHVQPEIGMALEMRAPDGSTMGVTVVGMADEYVTLDANHPLAGEELHFDITLVRID